MINPLWHAGFFFFLNRNIYAVFFYLIFLLINESIGSLAFTPWQGSGAGKRTRLTSAGCHTAVEAEILLASFTRSMQLFLKKKKEMDDSSN